jgi:hypothetical protein
MCLTPNCNEEPVDNSQHCDECLAGLQDAMFEDYLHRDNPL